MNEPSVSGIQTKLPGTGLCVCLKQPVSVGRAMSLLLEAKKPFEQSAMKLKAQLACVLHAHKSMVLC